MENNKSHTHLDLLMNERFIASFKLISSHIVLILLLLVASRFLSDYGFLLLIITQTVLLILYFSGYWEFFGLRFKCIFCCGMIVRKHVHHRVHILVQCISLFRMDCVFITKP